MMLENKNVLITGGSRGIGAATAILAAERGANVFVNYRSNHEAAAGVVQTCRSLGAKAGSLAGNVGDEADVLAMFAACTEQIGTPDVLINNAGVAGQAGPVETLDLAQWRNCLSVNLDAQMLTCRAVVPAMKQQKSGAIINMSSTSGLFGAPFRAPYAAAKWAVIGSTKTIATELGPHGIRCNAICPGAVAGERMDRVLAAEAAAKDVTPDDVYTDYASGSSMRRFAQPEEIAQLCLYLSSDAARFVSGQAIAVDGNTETYHSV